MSLLWGRGRWPCVGNVRWYQSRAIHHHATYLRLLLGWGGLTGGGRTSRGEDGGVRQRRQAQLDEGTSTPTGAGARLLSDCRSRTSCAV